MLEVTQTRRLMGRKQKWTTWLDMHSNTQTLTLVCTQGAGTGSILYLPYKGFIPVPSTELAHGRCSARCRKMHVCESQEAHARVWMHVYRGSCRHILTPTSSHQCTTAIILNTGDSSKSSSVLNKTQWESWPWKEREKLSPTILTPTSTAVEFGIKSLPPVRCALSLGPHPHLERLWLAAPPRQGIHPLEYRNLKV